MSCEDSSYCPSLGEETDALLGSRAVKSQGGFFKTRIRGQRRVRSLIGGLDKPRLRNPSNHLAGDTLFDLLFGDFSKFSTFDLEHKSSDLIFVRHKRTRRHTLDPSGGSASEMLLELVLVVSQFCARRRDRGAINDYLFLTKNLPSLFWLFVETRI